jgi:hypothetical protein
VLRDEPVSVILLICIKFGIYVMMVAQTSQFYLEVSKFDAALTFFFFEKKCEL